jgi:hypothetical protein
VTLQIVGSDGSELGLIGAPVGSLGSTGIQPVTLASSQGGYILQGPGPSYLVSTPSCPGSLGNVTAAGDFGNICLVLSGASGCQQPMSLTPSALIFGSQVVGSPTTSQTIALVNTSGTDLGSVTLTLANNSGAPNFSETDTCGVNGIPSLGEPFDIGSGQSCVITITFAPQETCAPGTPPSQCPSPLLATLMLNIPSDDVILTVPITGTGTSPGEDSKRESNGSDPDVEHHAQF